VPVIRFLHDRERPDGDEEDSHLSDLIEDKDTILPIAFAARAQQGDRGHAAAPPEEDDKIASSHATTYYSISSSARMSNASGTSRPSAFAVVVLITTPNLVANWIGKSPGFSPLRMRST
jgi:hypothetical protein